MNRLALLGPIQVTRDNEPVRGFESRKALGLLCYLAVRAQPVSRVELANLLWGDKTEAQGRGNLSRVLNNLSSLFPNGFLTDRESVQAKPNAFEIDCAEFDRVTNDEGRMTNVPDFVLRLSSLVSLYRGEFMSGMYLDDCPDFEIWLVQERERWQQRIVSVLECLGGYYARRGEFATALPFAARLLEIEPWREETHREMMKLLAQTNQRSAALQQYENARRVLQEELGVEPSAETNALYEKIRVQEITPLATPSHNLPAHLTTFFGRETELTRIAARLNNPDCRLLTLVGAGGMGKTRLAIEAAKNVLNSFRDGVYLVPLASIGAGQTQFIVPAMANALNLSLNGQQEPKTQVLNFLRDKQMLLLLDNFEHLIEGAQLVVEILQNAPQLKISVTSREPLNVQAEWITRVEGLSYPTTASYNTPESSHYSAVQLFVERAQRADESFALNPETAPHIIRLAQIVEGMPLALELAAARTRTLRVHEIRVQVEASFDFLATTMRDVDERHKSLRAMLDWSYGLLSLHEQALFRRLSVFAGGWTHEAASHVAGNANTEELELKLLSSQSFILTEETQGAPRYRMLEPIRQFAEAKLVESGLANSVRESHLAYFTEFAEGLEPMLRGVHQAQYLDTLATEMDNFRVSLTWSLTGGSLETGFRLLAIIYNHWEQRRSMADLYILFKQFLARLDELPRTRTRAMVVRHAAWHAIATGQADTAQAYLKELLAIAQETGDAELMLEYLATMGAYVRLRNDLQASADYKKHAVRIAQNLGKPEVLADTLQGAGRACLRLGDIAEASKYIEQALEIAEQFQDERGAVEALGLLSEIAFAEGDYKRFHTLILLHLERARALGDMWEVGLAHENSAKLAMIEGKLVEANQRLREGLGYFLQPGIFYPLGARFDVFARVAAANTQFARAAILFGAAEKLREMYSQPVAALDLFENEKSLVLLRQDLEHAVFESAWEKGRAMSLEQAIDFALNDAERAIV